MSQYSSERIMLLNRLGTETIIKRGTYDIIKPRPITQDHPFYEHKTEEVKQAQEAVPTEEEASALAAQILSNNFRVGMSQSDVDCFLAGMSG